MDRFKIGDIVVCTIVDLGNLLITARKKDYYRAIIITGKFDGTKVRLEHREKVEKVGNIFEWRKVWNERKK